MSAQGNALGIRVTTRLSPEGAIYANLLRPFRAVVIVNTSPQGVALG